MTCEQNDDLKNTINIDKLRCKDVNIKRSHPIEPKKGKGSKYKRDKTKWKKEICKRQHN